MSHRYLAVQLIEIFTKIEGYPVKRLERAMEPLAHLIKVQSALFKRKQNYREYCRLSGI